MENLLDSFISFSLSQLLLCLILLLRQYRVSKRSENFFIALLLAYACYLLTPWLSSVWLGYVLFIGQSALPALLWLFCCSLFDDHYRLRPWQLTLALMTLVLPVLGLMLKTNTFAGQDYLTRVFPQALEFVLLVMALAVVLRHWRSDLLEQRRSLRVWFSGFIGVYTLSIISARELIFPGETWLHTWQYLPAGLVLLVCNCCLLEFKGDVFESITGTKPSEPEAEPQSVESVAPVDEVPAEIVQAITEQMEIEKAYREMGLTIGQLAKQLELQEYRLRRIINAGMGYRNFNDFLNSYRIREASQRLRDETETAVLNIALDVGFRSLSSFNKAFKDTQLMTPTAYRNQEELS